MRKVFFALLILIFVVSLAINSYLSRPYSQDTNVQNFVVNQGEGVGQIGARLEKNKLIKSQYYFIYTVTRLNLSSKLQAGLFKLSPSQTPESIAEKLAKGGSHDYWLKIIDGQRLLELSQKFPPNLEGYLFPDSYLVPEYYDTAQILSLIKTNFDNKYSQASVGSTNKMTQAEIIILASILEREARSLNSKRQVAGVLLNRLRSGVALQVDASVQYARDSLVPHPTDYWKPIKKSDLAIKSPFNTYLYPGLPPSPICNPGYDSIYAALHPIENDYMYYITGNDNQMHYAKSLSEHNANIAKYLK